MKNLWTEDGGDVVHIIINIHSNLIVVYHTQLDRMYYYHNRKKDKEKLLKHF